jgi:hypothetical protein
LAITGEIDCGHLRFDASQFSVAPRNSGTHVFNQIAALITDVIRGIVSFMRDLVIGVLANPTVRTSSIGLKASSLQDEVTRCLYERDFRTVYGNGADIQSFGEIQPPATHRTPIPVAVLVAAAI